MHSPEISPQAEGATGTRLVSGRQVDAASAGDYAAQLYDFGDVAPAIDGLGCLTDQHVAQYHEQGYLAIERAFSVARVSDACAALTRLLDAETKDPASVQFEAWASEKISDMDREARLLAVRKFMDFTRTDTVLDGIARDPQLLALVRRLIGGEEPILLQEMALLKSPGGREKPWHQDRAYFNVEPGAPVVGVWIALDAATPENGCMRLWPGRHRGQPIPHFQRRDWQICDTHIADNPRVAVPLQPGGLLIFDSLLPHGTPHNATNNRRWALQFHYCAATAERTDDAARMAIFGAEGKNVQC
jgi:phytanoyl-CoA hydroxylase